MNQDLNEIDVSLPVNGSSSSSIITDVRTLKEVLKNVILTAHNSDGTLKTIVSGSTVLGDDSVSTSNIQDLAVTTGKIEDLNVTSGKLANDAVTTGKYADDSIPATAFKDASIAPSRLTGALVGGQITSSATVDADRAIGTDHIKDNAVTSAKVSSLGVDKLTGGVDGEVLLRTGGVWTPASFGGDITFSGGVFSVLTGLKLAIIGDVKAVNSGGGAATAGGWKTRDLGELSDVDNIITFAGNSFSLLEGSYLLYVKVPAYGVGAHQARLVLNNGVDPESAVSWGSSENSVASGSQTASVLLAGFAVGDPTWVYRIEHYCATTVGANDLGFPVNGAAGLAGQQEVFTHGYLVKLT